MKKIPERTLLVDRYHGGWLERSYNEHVSQLNKEAQSHNIRVKSGSQPIWARYNSPMAPAPIRTNEVMFEVEA